MRWNFDYVIILAASLLGSVTSVFMLIDYLGHGYTFRFGIGLTVLATIFSIYIFYCVRRQFGQLKQK